MTDGLSATTLTFIRKLADAIVQASNQPIPGAPQSRMTWGVVYSTQDGPPPTLTLLISGSSTPSPGISYLTTYAPKVGDTVYATWYGPDLVVIGKITAEAGEGFYASLTGPGQTVTPGDLTQDGSLTITQLLTIDGVTIFVYAGDPNGHVTALAEGDLCVDTSSPGLWQAGAADDVSWVNPANAGSYASLTGAGQTSSPGELTQTGGFTIDDVAGDGVSIDTGLMDVTASDFDVTTSSTIHLESTGSGSGGDIAIHTTGAGSTFLLAALAGYMNISGYDVNVTTDPAGALLFDIGNAQVSGGTTTGVINGLVALGLFSS